MSIQLKNDKIWFSNKWITLQLFRNCLQFMEADTEIKKKIFFLEKVSIDHLDVTDFSDAEQELFFKILNQVIDYNHQMNGKDFSDPSYFNVYFDKLHELKKLMLAEN